MAAFAMRDEFETQISLFLHGHEGNRLLHADEWFVDDPKVDVIALNETQEEASKVSDTNGDAYKFLVTQIQSSFGGIPVAPDMTTGATDSRHYQGISDAVFRLDPFRFGPDDLGRVHGTNERLAIRDLAPAVGFYMRLMQNAK